MSMMLFFKSVVFKFNLYDIKMPQSLSEINYISMFFKYLC